MKMRLLFLCGLSVCVCNGVLNGKSLEAWDRNVRLYGQSNIADEKLLRDAADGIDLKDYNKHVLSVIHVPRLYFSVHNSRTEDTLLSNIVTALINTVKGNPVLLGRFCSYLRFYIRFIPELTPLYNELLELFNRTDISEEQEKTLLLYISTRGGTVFTPVTQITGRAVEGSSSGCAEIRLDITKLQDRDRLGIYMFRAFENHSIEMFQNKNNPGYATYITRCPTAFVAESIINNTVQTAVDILVQLTELLDTNKPDHNNRDRNNDLVLDAIVEVGKVLKRLQQNIAQAAV